MPSLRRVTILAAILNDYVFQIERVHPVVFFGQFQDDSIYFSTAKALADGRGYKLIPDSPPQTKYPIVYPWLLSSPNIVQISLALCYLEAVHFCGPNNSWPSLPL